MNLAQFELMGKAEDINEEVDKYNAVKVEEIRDVANKIFQTQNCSKLYYLSKAKKEKIC